MSAEHTDADATDARSEDPPRWRVDGRIYGPEDFVRMVEARDKRIGTLQETVEAQAERIDELEARLADVEADTGDQWDAIEGLETDTSLLHVLEDADKTSASEARAAILQHMYRMVRDEDGEDRRYAMTKAKTAEILHGPDVDGSTINRWMRTAAEKVGDESICRYDGGDPGRGGREAKIILDLVDGDVAALPDQFHNGGR